jgi:hypothetical protein
VAREELKRSVKAYRVYLNGKLVLQGQVKADYNEYKKLVNQAKTISRRYIEQTKRPKW